MNTVSGRYYHLPVSEHCRLACSYCDRIGNKSKTYFTKSKLVENLGKARSGEYRACILPCNLLFRDDWPTILEELNHWNFEVVLQVHVVSLLKFEDEWLDFLKKAALVSARQGGLRLNILMDSDLNLREQNLVILLTQKYLSSVTVVVSLQARVAFKAFTKILKILNSLPNELKLTTYFYFPISGHSNGFSFLTSRNQIAALHKTLRQLRNHFNFRDREFLPPQNMDIFDPRIPLDLELEPDIKPEWEVHQSQIPPVISVVVPSFNASSKLRATLQCLAHQSLAHSRYEVIIVDDGGDDDTRIKIQQLAHLYMFPLKYIYFSRVRQRTRGDESFRAGIARNLGVKWAKGKYVLFLDSDILIPPYFLEQRISQHLKSEVIMSARFTLSKKFSSGIEDIKRIFEIDLKNHVIRSDEPYWERFYAQSESWDLWPDKWKYICSHSLSLSRDVFKKVGWYRKTFTSYGYEDSELGYRLHKFGAHFQLDPNDVYHLFVDPTQSEYQKSEFKKRQLLAHSAVTFCHNTLDPLVLDHCRKLTSLRRQSAVWIKGWIKGWIRGMLNFGNFGFKH